MAAEWIKMRAELWTHPKFLSLCKYLIFNDDPGMLIYACGQDALEIGVLPKSNKSVTEIALRCVTESALHDVTMGALLRVWCAVNSHCKVEDVHAICSPMDTKDLDRIAGFDGFGKALAYVGWVKEEEHKSLLFPNFLEFNEPACLRKRAMTNAERQAEFRRRNGGVTKVTKSNAREEKRREEKSNKEKNKQKRNFDPPLLEDVAAYCAERGNEIDPEAFMAHYTANGWVQGRGQKPIRDWKAAVVTWEKNAEKTKPVKQRVLTDEEMRTWEPKIE